MSTRTQMMDDKDVGRGTSSFFKPEKGLVSRVALIPAFLSKKELSEDQELLKGIEAGLDKTIPTTEKYTHKDEEGYLWPRVDSAPCFYMDNVGWFTTDSEDAQDLASVQLGREPSTQYGVVVYVYETTPDGEVQRVEPKSEGQMNFRGNLMLWTLTSARMREWKNFHRQFPPIFSDYEVTLEKSGRTDRIKFSTCKTCLWRECSPEVQDTLIRKAAPLWERVPKAVASKTYSLEDLRTIYQLGSETTKGDQETSFQKLLGDSDSD